MAWPNPDDYYEAVQNPQTCFADPDLRTGQVFSNAQGLPLPWSGNFADVYRVDCARSQRTWAVKCFTREVVGLARRYAVIADWLKQVKLPFTVDFQYLEQGIRVHGRSYPVLKMDWVKGQTLNDFVREQLDKPHILERGRQALGEAVAHDCVKLGWPMPTFSTVTCCSCPSPRPIACISS